MNRFFCVLISFLFITASFIVADSQPLPPELKQIQITEKLGESFSTVSFLDVEGKPISFNLIESAKTPVIINFVYYNCPMLCGLALDGVVQLLQTTTPKLGDDFQLVTISIDPKDTPEKSRSYRDKLFKRLGYAQTQKGWHFWVGDEPTIKVAANSVGFGYRYNPETKEYAHSAALVVLSPSGKIVRYLHGVDHRNLDLKLALIEAREEKLHSSVDKILMFCYNYDPNSRGYVLQAINVMKVGAVFGAVLLAIFIVILFRFEKLKNRKTQKIIKND